MNEKNNREAPSDRRVRLLHEACKRISKFTASGFRVGRAIASEARKVNGSPLAGGKVLNVSAKSMRRHWDRWNKERKSPHVFALNYSLSQRAKTDPLLLELIVRRCMRTGESLPESVSALKRQGARITVRDVKNAAKKFLRSIEDADREVLKQQRDLFSALLKQYTRTEIKLHRERCLLQNALLENSLHALKAHASLVRKTLTGHP